MKSLVILGRQPAIGLAELESLYGAGKLRPVGKEAAVLDVVHTEIDFMRLGGMIKFCKVLTVLETIKWSKIQEFLEHAVPSHAANLPEGKLTLGLSAYDLAVSPKRVAATGLTLKKLVRSSGRPVRLVPNNEIALSSAQVLHNGLTRKQGWELVFVRSGDNTIVAQSIAVQDIEAYTKRDRERPARDTRVGMLPPKLAQIITNLAVSTADLGHGSIVLDPFCGTGVVLQEASLMGFDIAGSDLEPRMVEYTDKNLLWLGKFHPNLITHSEDGRYYKLRVADATSHHWFSQGSPLSPQGTTIACETYLGRPFSSPPDTSTLQKVIQDVDTIHKKFLQNVARQTDSGFRMCIAVPAWKTKNSFRHLPALEKLDELGYNRLKFVHANDKDLIYHRPGQIVARELVVLIRK